MNKVLLSSGGMDSFLLAHQPEVLGATHVFVDIGQSYKAKEWLSAARVARSCGSPFVRVQGPDLAKHEHFTGIIPFRNAQMILLAALHGEEIYFGVIADEINSDKSVEFCKAMEDTLNISHRKQYWTKGKQFSIRTPFREQTKSDLLRQYIANGGTIETALTTVSCYDGGALHCGCCASCFKRWVALTNVVGRSAWQEWGFIHDPQLWHTREYWQGKMAEYADRRGEEIKSAFELSGHRL